MKKTLLFLANGFETMEFSVFVDVMGWARNDYGIDVQLDTCGFTKQVTSTFGLPVIVDKLIDEINMDDYDALAIPGGFEEFHFYDEAFDPLFSELIRQFHRRGKIVASICVAALAIGKSGILEGKRATTYHIGGHRQKQLADFGVEVVNEPIVITDNIITSWCPQTAPGVAFTLLEMLAGKDAADQVKAGMGYSV